MFNKFSMLFLCLVFSTGYSILAQNPRATDSSDTLTMEKVLAAGPAYEIIKTFIGTWKVQQKIWNKASGEPTVLPPFVARRKMTGHFLEEVMEPAPGAGVEPFTRITYLNFNNASLNWEHIVLDSRYPLMMFETSVENGLKNGKELTLYLPAFIMPPGFESKLPGQLAKQRRTMLFESADKMVTRQYWTLPGGKEFIAMEYTYTREK